MFLLVSFPCFPPFPFFLPSPLFLPLSAIFLICFHSQYRLLFPSPFTAIPVHLLCNFLIFSNYPSLPSSPHSLPIPFPKKDFFSNIVNEKGIQHDTI